MTIHRREFDGVNITLKDIPEELPKNHRIEDSVLNLTKPNFLYFLGGYDTEDNIACDAKSFEQAVATRHPLLHEFLDKLSIFTDVSTHYGLLTLGCHALALGNVRSIQGVIGYWPMTEPDIHLISHPELDGCMKEYEYTQADPKHYFSDHALRIAMHTLGGYLGKNVICRKNEDGQWEISGIKHSVNDVLQATRNLTVMGNSFGSLFTVQYENAIKHIIKELQYSPKELRRIMTSIRAFSIGTISPFAILKDTPAHPDPRFTMVALEGINDVVGLLKNPYKASITDAEVMKWIPPERRENFLHTLRIYEQQMQDSLRDRKAFPFPEAADPAEQPDALPNQRFFILRRIAPNRLHIITAVPTYGVRWRYESPAAQTEGILAGLQELAELIPVAPAQERRVNSMTNERNLAQLGSVVRVGDDITERNLLKVLGDIKPEQADHTRELLREVFKRRKEFAQYLTEKDDRAGHDIGYYFWSNHPLSHLCRRLVYNAVTYAGAGPSSRKNIDVLDLLNPVDPGHDPFKRLCDSLLDPLIEAQVSSLRRRSRNDGLGNITR